MNECKQYTQYSTVQYSLFLIMKRRRIEEQKRDSVRDEQEDTGDNVGAVLKDWTTATWLLAHGSRDKRRLSLSLSFSSSHNRPNNTIYNQGKVESSKHAQSQSSKGVCSSPLLCTYNFYPLPIVVERIIKPFDDRHDWINVSFLSFHQIYQFYLVFFFIYSPLWRDFLQYLLSVHRPEAWKEKPLNVLFFLIKSGSLSLCLLLFFLLLLLSTLNCV